MFSGSSVFSGLLISALFDDVVFSCADSSPVQVFPVAMLALFFPHYDLLQDASYACAVVSSVDYSPVQVFPVAMIALFFLIVIPCDMSCTVMALSYNWILTTFMALSIIFSQHQMSIISFVLLWVIILVRTHS